MRTKLCWICGESVKQSAVGQAKYPFYLEVRIVQVSRPYSGNHKSKPVFICDGCAVNKIGMSGEGKNLNA